MRRFLTLALIASIVFRAPATAGPPQQRQITWSGLSDIVGEKVRITMPDGARIEGKAMDVEPDALVVDVRKTANPSLYPKGRLLVPRATLRAFEINHPTQHWRLVSTGLAVLPALILVLIAGSLGGGGRAAAIGGAAGLPAVAYLLGRAADQRVTTYLITQ